MKDVVFVRLKVKTSIYVHVREEMKDLLEDW